MSRGRAARALLLALGAAALGWDFPAPHSYGRVVLDNFASRAKAPPVAFDHFRHRARYTCRLCHVDVGFAMQAGQTRVSAATNRAGYHCGACHDGARTFAGKPIFAACSEEQPVPQVGACRRCHVEGAKGLAQQYAAFSAELPKRPAGGHVDWEVAEANGRIRPLDAVEGVSIPRPPLKMDKEVALAARSAWMADVLFSHKKHAIWNGCEVCHPALYPAARQGSARATMLQISSGESCGVCHDKVAFPLAECQRCHVKPVQ